MRRLFGGGVAVADRLGVVAPVGVLAMAILAGVAPFALAAHDIVLDEDEIAFLEALAAGELATGLGDVADVLVTHDDGRRSRRMGVELDVGAADARDFHLHQRRVVGDIRHGIFAEFGFAGAGANRRENFLDHLGLLQKGLWEADSTGAAGKAISPRARAPRHAGPRSRVFPGRWKSFNACRSGFRDRRGHAHARRRPPHE